MGEGVLLKKRKLFILMVKRNNMEKSNNTHVILIVNKWTFERKHLIKFKTIEKI